MTCDSCGKTLHAASGSSLAALEDAGHRCDRCGNSFCGSCCLPSWEELKRRTGMSGAQLEMALDDEDPSVEAQAEALDVDFEPKCPQCGGTVKESLEPAWTPVTRSGSVIPGLFFFAALLAGGAAYAWADGYRITAAVMVGLAAFFLRAAFPGSWCASCPRCRTRMEFADQGIVGPCATCLHYSRWNTSVKRLRLLPEDTTGPRLFSLPVETVLGSLPKICCGCGAPAMRGEEVKVDGRIIRVPHCRRCTEQAEAGSDSFVGSSDPSQSRFSCVRVASYRFYCAAAATSGRKYFQ